MKNVKTFPQFLWAIAMPIFPLLRLIFVRAGLITPPSMERHRFPLGFLRPGFSEKEFLLLMRERGFFIQPMAFVDPGQALSLRRLDPENPRRQYHIRLYKDGEVRGHYEKTPEDHPLDHLREAGFEEKKDVFLKMLSGLIEESIAISLSSLESREMQDPREVQLHYATRLGAENGEDR